MFQRILVPWDGSELADRAFATASDLGGAYDAQITAICVLAPAQRRHSLTGGRHDHERPRAGGASPERIEALFAQRHIDRERPAPDIELRVIEGHDIVAELLDFAHEHGFDLIVIGHHHSRKPDHIFPHGLTECLIFSARVPVLVVAG